MSFFSTATPAPVSGMGSMVMPATVLPTGGKKSMARPERPPAGNATWMRTSLRPCRSLNCRVTSVFSAVFWKRWAGPSCNEGPAPAARPGGLSASSHEVSSSTTTPRLASMPSARRRRCASGAVIVVARVTRWLMNWRAATPTNTIATTTSAFITSTRPWLVPN